MVVMMFGLILTTAAAPTLQREMQREKEEEMLWRGQQIVVAIRNYRQFREDPSSASFSDMRPDDSMRRRG
jgi:hypothetical protein